MRSIRVMRSCDSIDAYDVMQSCDSNDAYDVIDAYDEIMIIIASELVVSSCLKLLNKTYTKQLTPSQQQCDARQTILHAASSEQHMYSKVLLL